jgi:6,7-dimethyl-8-ribityllumazine synthase
MRVQLETSVPVFSAVLTPQQFHEHPDHIDFFARHLHGKGEEVARTCVTTLRSLQTLAS